MTRAIVKIAAPDGEQLNRELIGVYLFFWDEGTNRKSAAHKVTLA
jgi:hypothetical protein